MRMRDTDRDENTEAPHEKTALHLISFLKSFYALTNRFVSLLLLYLAKESTLGVLNIVAVCTAIGKLLRLFKTLKKKTCPQSVRQPKKMPARHVVSNGLSNSNIKYSRLATDDDGYIDLQVGDSSA